MTLHAHRNHIDSGCFFLFLQSVETLVWDSPLSGKVVREWQEDGTSMMTARDSLTAVAVQSHVYALGGYNGSVELSSVEMNSDFGARQRATDEARNTWKAAPNMRKRRSHLGAAVVGNRLFAIGGYNGTHDLPNTEFLRLHASGEPAGSWQWGPTMSCKRTAPAVVSLAGKLYVFGGYDGQALTASAQEMHVSSTSLREEANCNHDAVRTLSCRDPWHGLVQFLALGSQETSCIHTAIFLTCKNKRHTLPTASLTVCPHFV
jgi:hypothetical protein